MSQSEVIVSLGSFVKELALAWQKLSMYQPGHPERRLALDRSHAVLAGLVAPTGSLSLGVGRTGLIGPEEKLNSVPASRLAAALYPLEVAVLRFEEGVESDDLEILLNLLPRTDALREGMDLELELQQNGVRHIRVESVDFTGLLATDNLDGPEYQPEEESLWDRILQRLLDDPQFSFDSDLLSESGDSPFGQLQATVGRVLDHYGISGDVLEESGDNEDASVNETLEALSGAVGEVVGNEMTEAPDEGSRRIASRHVTELLSAMPVGMRHPVLDAAVREMVTRDEAAPGLSSLGSAVSAAQMVGSLRRLRAEKVSFSPRVVSVVESLVSEGVREGNLQNRSHDPEQLAEELRSIFADEDVERVSHSGALDERIFVELRRQVPVHAMFADLSPYLDTITDSRIDTDLSMTLIDLIQRPFLDDTQIRWVIGRQQETFKAMLAAGRFEAATGIVEGLQHLIASGDQIKPVQRATEQCLEGLREPETLSGLVDVLGEVKSSNIGEVHHLIKLMGPMAIHQLLCVLGEESELSRRRHIFDLLVSLGPSVVPASIELLDDERWYMIRNILSLLRRVGQGLTLDVLHGPLGHEDSRVRIEAVKCLSDMAEEIPSGLVEKIVDDEDLRVAEMAVVVIGNARIQAAAGPLAEMLRRPDPMGRSRRLRLRAIKALGEIGDPSVLLVIAHFFRSWFALVSTEERHAAFRSLEFYPAADRRPWVKKGRLSPDPTVREICRGLGNNELSEGEE